MVKKLIHWVKGNNNAPLDWFSGRKLIIATQHKKENVITPVLERSLGVICITAKGLNTDLLGTFTGEIERKLNPVDASRRKCMQAMELSGADLAVASEGSFGPHPAIPFLEADDEFLILVDKANGLEILVREVSIETNFGVLETSSLQEVRSFAAKAGFPQHGLIVRSPGRGNAFIAKGIITREELDIYVEQALKEYGAVCIETDMRAMYNPSRMKVIEAAAEALARKAKSLCPSCHKPGFGVTDCRRGLPCSLCGQATESVLADIYSCASCNYQEEKKYPSGKKAEDPMYCGYCNP